MNRTRGDRLLRWSAGLVALGALALLPALGGWAWSTAPEEKPDPAAELVEYLADGGERGDVIQCVLRLAGDDLRLGPLDPAAQRELLAGCRTARHELERIEALIEQPEPAGPDDWPDAIDTLGDDPRLDELWLDCETGSGRACDLLFGEAPPGSTYEAFGLTCGDRPDLLHCAELDWSIEELESEIGGSELGPGSARGR